MHLIVSCQKIFATIPWNITELRRSVIGASQVKIEALDAQNAICIETCIRLTWDLNEYREVQCTVPVIGRYVTREITITPVAPFTNMV